MGPFLYCIANQDVLEAGAAVVREEQGHITAYLDDSPLVGPLPTLGRAYAAMRDAATARGLLFHPEKSILYRVPEGGAVPESLEGVQITQEGVEIMRCPIGTPAYVEAWCQRWVRGKTEELAALAKLPDVHAAITISESA